MRNSGPSDGTLGVDSLSGRVRISLVLRLPVRLHGLDEAVRSQDDRAREGGEVDLLVLPSTSVVSDEVLELLELRVAVGWEHFTVSVNVYSSSFGLYQEVVEVVDIVPGNEDTLSNRN